MKKAIALLLLAALCLSLCACGDLEKLRDVELPPLPTVTQRPEETPAASPAEETAPAEEAVPTEEPAPAEESAAPEAEAAAQDSKTVIVNFRKTLLENYDPAEGEQKILTFSYVTPEVTIPGREEAAKAINEYIAMLDETFYTGNDYGDGPSDGYYGMLEQAEDNYAYVVQTDSDFPLEFSCERNASVLRADGAVIALDLSTSSYTGGAHGFYSSRDYVFDAQTGALLTLDDLSEDPAGLRAWLLQRMLEMAETDPDLSAATADFVPAGEREESFGALLREGSWALTDRGLIVFSDLYEISSYAAGIQTFVFPYGELAGHIDARWIPGARRSAGKLLLLPAGSDTRTADKLELTEVGTDFLIAAEGTVYDVTLSRVAYSEYGGSFYDTELLWYCACLQDAALELLTDFPDGMPNLAVSCRGDDGETHRYLLTVSGEDGRLLLQEDAGIPG